MNSKVMEMEDKKNKLDHEYNLLSNDKNKLMLEYESLKQKHQAIVQTKFLK